MAGTIAGGLSAAQKNKERHGEDYYHRIGHLGGSKSRGGGFAANPKIARPAGIKGGTRSGEVRRAKRDKFIKPLLDQGYRYQDRVLLSPDKLDNTKAAYFEKRRDKKTRDTEWDKLHKIKAYGHKRKRLTRKHN